MMTHFGDSVYEIEDKVRRLKAITEHKLVRFADIIIQEFKYLNKLQSDQILFTVGYHDKLEKQLDHHKDGEIYNDLFSVASIPSFKDVKRELKNTKRANSICGLASLPAMQPTPSRSKSIKPKPLDASENGESKE